MILRNLGFWPIAALHSPSPLILEMLATFIFDKRNYPQKAVRLWQVHFQTNALCYKSWSILHLVVSNIALFCVSV